MRCDILAVGTELLLGQIADTNSAWLGEHLASLGIESYEHRHVGDNVERIADALEDMLANADALLVVGGLGPTQDDVTRDAIAKILGVELELRSEILDQISERFAQRGMQMPANNKRQAEFPKGTDVITNPLGTAPSIRAEYKEAVLYALPGVPTEMQAIFQQKVRQELLERSGNTGAIVSRVLKLWGTSESAIAELIADRVDQQTNPTIAFLARGIEGIWVRITARAATEQAARALIEPEEQALREVLGDLVFATDDQTMESVILDLLRELGLSLGVAESLTGGLVSARLVNIPGASDVFQGSVISYADNVKRNLLGVTAKHVISEETAAQMAQGVCKATGSEVGIAITGVAGPDEQDGQPVGTVCFGLSLPGKPAEAVSTRFLGGRQTIRHLATISLLNLLRLKLLAST